MYRGMRFLRENQGPPKLSVYTGVHSSLWLRMRRMTLGSYYVHGPLALHITSRPGYSFYVQSCTHSSRSRLRRSFAQDLYVHVQIIIQICVQISRHGPRLCTHMYNLPFLHVRRMPVIMWYVHTWINHHIRRTTTISRYVHSAWDNA